MRQPTSQITHRQEADRTPATASDGDLRVAIAHDWIDSRSGSEKVFEALARLYPRADLYTLTREPDVQLDFGGRMARTSLLDQVTYLRQHREVALPLMPLAWRRLGRHEEYDLVITSSHAAVKGFGPGRRTVHLSYCHTPMRYVWTPHLDTRALGGVSKTVVRTALRRWDRRAATYVDHFAANSTEVAERVAACYGRHAEVIHPPVDVKFFTAANRHLTRRNAIAFSRWIPYKRLDIAIRACIATGTPLVVAGSGPEEHRLRALARGHESLVTFIPKPSDEEVRLLYSSAAMLIFPALEDFGIVPVEAQACGTPVLGLNRGGTRDTVVHGETGYLVNELSVEAFAEGIEALRNISIDPDKCIKNSLRFSAERFDSALLSWVERGLRWSAR